MYLPYAAYAGLEQFTGGVEQLLSTDAIPTTATRHASQYISDNAKGVGKLAYDATSSIANMAPSVALGTLNPALGSAAMFGSVYGNSYNSALHEGKDRGEAQTYATLKAVSETALQKLLGGISALGGKIPGTLASSIENINNAAYRIAAKYGKSILGEGSEEYLQEILQPVIRNLAFNEDNEFRLISEDAAYAGLMGALTAGVFESGSVVRGENGVATKAEINISDAATMKSYSQVSQSNSIKALPKDDRWMKTDYIEASRDSAAAQVQWKLSEYGIHSFVVNDKKWNRWQAERQAKGKSTYPMYSHNGQVYMRETLDPELIRSYVIHEGTHVMKETGYKPYMDFLEVLPEKINMQSTLGQKVLEIVAEHRGFDIFDITDDVLVHFYDELAATAFGDFHHNSTNSRIVYGDVFYDFEEFIAKISELHYLFKQERKLKK